MIKRRSSGKITCVAILSPGIYNDDQPNEVNDATAASSIMLVPNYYADDDRYDDYLEQEEGASRRQIHKEDREAAEDVPSTLLSDSIVIHNCLQDRNKESKNNTNG
ncbi:hypothetical protein F1880_002203 [Penicillium rolfsii]|nr:hypothetical protein F1880_002203 [Penicillium rolfsii]